MKNIRAHSPIGPAVKAFDAQVEAEDSGELFTSDQWLLARRIPPSGLRAPAPIPRGRGSIPPPVMFVDVTRPIPLDELTELLDLCKRK